uniref:ferritin, heavy subunit-like n=1 Tax=Pristiophorus japonicus TaxID=55135 RepID=UPI00398EAF77
MASQVHQNYHQDCEDAVNKQINMELYSSYVYLSMSFYFDGDDSLCHLAEFFKEQSHEEFVSLLETHYLDEQLKMIKKLGDHITNLKRLGAPENGLGEYLFDKHTLGEE